MKHEAAVGQLPTIIVGGGIAGLSLAWQLQRLNQRVVVLEQNTVGSGASWAASAYLEPRPGTGGLREIEWSSLKRWPEFARQIESASGLSIDYRTDGLIDVSSGQNRNQQSRRIDPVSLEGSRLLDIEPELNPEITNAKFFKEVHWLDGRKLCLALSKAIIDCGGEVAEHQSVLGVEPFGSEVRVLTSSGDRRAESVVLCSGNGSNAISGLPQDIPKCRPVRGVMVTLEMDRTAPIIRHVIKHKNGVLCPRSDGRLLIGSTHEEGETSMAVSNELVASLMEDAAGIVPAVRELKLIEVACGIRALVGDGLLRLGQSKISRGLYYSLSHAGAGFLRAPVISEELAQFIVSNDAPCPLITKYLARA